MNSILIWIFLYVVAIIGISWWASRSGGEEGFLIAGRDRGTLQIFFSKFAGSVGVAWFLAYTGYAYQYGFSTLAIVPSLLISFTLFAYWAGPRIFKDSHSERFYTQGDYVAHQTGNPGTKMWVDVVSIMIALVWISVSFIGGAKVIEQLGIMSYGPALLVTSVAILIYILISGFRAVVITDIVQGSIIFILLIVMVVYVGNQSDIGTILATPTDTLGIGTILGFIVYGLFSVFGSSERYQLCFAAKGKSQVTNGLMWSIIPVGAAVCMLLIVGLYIAGNQAGLDPDTVFLVFVMEYLPTWLYSLGAILIFAGLMSSADTAIYTSTSYLTFLRKDRERPVHFLRKVTIGVVLIEALFAFFFRDIIGASILSGTIAIIASIAMIYIIAGGTSSRKFIASIVGAIITCIIGFIVIGLDPAVVVTPIVGGVLGLLWKRESTTEVSLQQPAGAR